MVHFSKTDKTRIIIESGVFKGLGTGLLIFALHKNSIENTTTKPEFIGLDIKLKTFFIMKIANQM